MAHVPMIGMQDCLNFKLTSPKRGKLQMSQLYSAYNKTSLSSIPRNVEVILLKENRINSSILKDYPTKPTIKSKEAISPSSKSKALDNNKNTKESFLLHSLSLSNKGYGNGFTSTLNRFDNQKTLSDKYSPGPGEYNYDEQALINTKARFRYNSLYSNHNLHPLRRKQRLGENIPGPGFYNIEATTSKIQDTSKLSPSFMSKRIRFKDFKIEKLGPGYYNEHRQSKWNSSMPSSCFSQISIKDSLLCPEKYIRTGKKSMMKACSPGPGDYEIKSRFDNNVDNNKRKRMRHLLASSLFYSNSNDSMLISPELKELNSILKEEKMLKSNSLIINQTKCNNNNTTTTNTTFIKDTWSKEIKAPFLSTTKRSTIFNGNSNHNPGPCYYQN